MRYEPELIERVRQHESLYNPEHPDYKNMRIRLALWDEIGRKLNVDPRVCRRRWQNLRRFHRRIRIKTKLSGVFPKQCKQKQFEQLEFFERFRKKNTKYDNLLLGKSETQEGKFPPVHEDIDSAAEEDLYVNETDKFYIESICDMLSEDDDLDENMRAQPNDHKSIIRDGDESQQSSISILRISPIPETNVILTASVPTPTTETFSAPKKLKMMRKTASSSSSSSKTCGKYLSAMGGKIDEMLIPDVVRYDLEKKVADLVYDVLEKYSKKSMNNYRFRKS